MKTLLLSLLLFAAAVNVHAHHGDAGGHADDALDSLRALLNFEQETFLDVDDAFKLNLTGVAADRARAAFTIADGYYLYRDKIKFVSDDGVRLPASLPAGVVKTDPYFGEMAVLKHDFTAPVGVAADADGLRVRATYQGCADGGICYAPVTKFFNLKLPAVITAAAADTTTSLPVVTDADGQPATPTLPLIIAGAFLAGLLLTFTPCVLPMLPIVSGVIAGQRNLTRARGASLALGYVLGAVAAYTAIGALAGAVGVQLQAYFQNIWAIGILCAVLVAMALSLFGFYKLQAPSFIQSRMQTVAGGMTGALPWVFLLGALSAVIVGACVSPILISFLSLAIAAGDPYLGAGMMASLALGMGVPLLAIGLGAGALLPRVGAWMTTVNHLLGAALIAVAIYLLGALPAAPVLLLWGAFFIIGSVYLGATQTLPADAGGGRRFVKGVGIIFLVWGIVAFVGGLFGQRDVLRPLPANLFTAGATDTTPVFTRVGGVGELERAFARAGSENKPVMLEYYADWCVDCARMEKNVFSDARVREVLNQNFVALKVDVTDPRDDGGNAIKKKFNVFGPPAVLFFNRDGAPLADKHFYGYLNRADFLKLITGIASDIN